MKKLCLLLGFLVFFGLLAFADTAEQEEIDFLLFLPNSSNHFVNEAQAMVQLDKLANYLKGRNLVPGQINIFGYAAAVINNIEPVNLSRDRALFVINELQKRGISKDLFSDPIGYGSVNLWGNNTNEKEQSPNRRVRIVLDGNILTPETLKAATPETKIPDTDSNKEIITQEDVKAESSSGFPWLILLALIIAVIIIAIIFLLWRKRRSSNEVIVQEMPPVSSPVIVSREPDTITQKDNEQAATIIVIDDKIEDKYIELDEEEIRRRAYELFLERGCQHGYANEDWYRAERDIIAKYEAAGYKVIWREYRTNA